MSSVMFLCICMGVIFIVCVFCTQAEMVEAG